MAVKSIPALRLWRIVKRCPATFWREFWAPLWNRDQFLALVVAFVGTVLIYQRQNQAEMIAEASDWVFKFEVFGWALIVWAGFMAIRTPFVAISEERAKGEWHGGRFIYDRPLLVKTLRCKATGQPQFHRIVFEDAEPNTFVYYLIEVENDPPRELYTAVLVSGMVALPHDINPGGGAGAGGLRIGPDKSAELLITMQENMVSQTVRIYMRNFSYHNPKDKDGDEGEFREPFRRVARGDGKGRSA